MKSPHQWSNIAFSGAGVLGGVISVLAFCVVHQLLISPIWFAVIAMMIAGALCGASLAWSYSLAVRKKTIRSWSQYNALYVVLLVALGATSLVIFEPVTTITALLQSKEPPRTLIARALPFTTLFVVLSAGLLTTVYRSSWRAAGAIFVTNVIVVLFLGLNISILGLVSVPKASLWVLAEVLTLLITLTVVYVAVTAYVSRGQFEIDVAPPNTR